MDSFRITIFGPINKVDVQLGDLTILLGPQASGKTLFLQMLNHITPIVRHGVFGNDAIFSGYLS